MNIGGAKRRGIALADDQMKASEGTYVIVSEIKTSEADSGHSALPFIASSVQLHD
jgi:hypothetical protein